MGVQHKKVGDACPKCGEPLEEQSDKFYWRGVYYPGFVCQGCNGLWTKEGNNLFDGKIR